MEATLQQTPQTKEKKHYFSKPLLKQSIQANWVMWLILTLGSVLLFVIINLVLGPKGLFNKIDIDAVSRYIKDEDMDWFKVLGLLQVMGFDLARIQVMATVDLNSIMNDLVFKIAGALLPMIYVIVTSNKLIAAQVNNGSMAYILSTPTNRKKVVRTQMFFMFVSIALMYIVIMIACLVSELIGFAAAGKFDQYCDNMHAVKTIFYCLGSMICMFGLGGFCFGCSGWFNKSKDAIGLGGGICVLSFLCCILGLFGSKVFVSVGLGVEAMYVFNYASIFTLMDTDSMSQFIKSLYDPNVVASYDWIWKFAILLVFGFFTAWLGGWKFTKKDLPL